ncbi:MAG: hypothetical protein IT426_01035 [Pirellulales bacterium]|nr:hypothetical protein [Pirellulales bacterium]
MWQAAVVSWLMLMSSGQLELNAPQNAVNRPETAAQPAWRPTADGPADQPLGDDSVKAAPQPAIGDTRSPNNLPPGQSGAAETDSAPTPDLPKPLLTRQTYFSLPARSDAAPKNNGQLVEVQLFVSTDRGAHWNFYSRAKPDQPRIPFRTAADGEYWFATRTLDRSGKFEPRNVTAPAVVVNIDTKPPTVLLSAEAAPGGQVAARWEISDPHLKPDSLSLQYRFSTGGAWQPVAIDENECSTTETASSGAAVWRPIAGAQEVVVRAEVSDTLGNKAVAHAQVKLGPGGSASDGLAKDDAKNEPQAISASANSRLGNRNSTGAASALLSNPYLAYLPPDEKPRMVNARVFELDYDLEAVGPSGVGRVELFGTRDGGRTWRSYGIDADNRSPMSVQVEEETMYGFRIIVTSGAGLGEAPPKSGDKPSIWIGVDLTRPAAKITAAEFGGNDENKLVVTWDASDKMLAEKPVTLYYGAQAGGPFTPFASNLENSGRYAWSIDGTVPPLIYLRLEVADEAGNRALCDHPQPIPLDRSRPTGRIRDVRPAGK